MRAHDWKLFAILLFIQSTKCEVDVAKELERSIECVIPQNDNYCKFEEITNFQKAYDFIIVGCGTAGSVLANRLSEDTNINVLCLEAGEEESALTDVPFLPRLSVDSQYNWGYKTERQQGICEGMEEKRCNWPRGKALGGSSVINYMLYNRGNPLDYDYWSKIGNTGWSYDEVEPFFRKFENVNIADFKNDSIHGTNGELNIEFPPYRTKIAPKHFASAAEFGIPVKDIDGREQIGISYVEATIHNGRRMSAAKAFLWPVSSRKNLHIAKNAQVTKIVIDPVTKTAKGVEFSFRNAKYTADALKEVVISAGVINSAQLLIISGVGPKEHLKELDIDEIQDLPVGEYLQDHVTFAGLVFLVDAPVTLVDGRLALNPANAANYYFRGEGPFTVPGGVEAYAFLNTKQSRNESAFLRGVPDIELLFTGGKRPPLGYSAEIASDVYSPISTKDGFSIAVVLLQPKSYGKLKLKSKNPFDKPLLYSNYYQDHEDLRSIVRGIRWAIKFGTSKALRKFNSRLYEKPYQQCSHHPFSSDEYWICAARLLPSTLFHQVGTCRMGPDSDPTAVVDPQLRVKGVNKLRVVDGSVIRKIPAAHTMSTTYMIAEKAAKMIKDTWT